MLKQSMPNSHKLLLPTSEFKLVEVEGDDAVDDAGGCSETGCGCNTEDAGDKSLVLSAICSPLPPWKTRM